ncbi:hypothetical protein EK21DRAFT_110290 [Setomelanomma holmii]|uniref:Uncharacterized protein n=1 Tax=Setomelanomma holmii TaxID=210430 RepID=A0A9P4HCG3_9PLEO|nr:hypothetical protein EK21DRAFT_110290 [Setomelanomma holmii]
MDQANELQSFIRRPGPTGIYSHFSGLFFAVALLFDAVQLLNQTLRQREMTMQGVWARVLVVSTWLHWVVVTVSGLVCAISYGCTPKPDGTGIQVLIFLNGALALSHLALKNSQRIKEHNADTECQVVKRPSGRKRCLVATGRYFDRLIKFIRLVVSILFIVGAINLARQYHFKKIRTTVQTTLPSGNTLSVNYHCITTPSSSIVSLPTFWFESTPAHGITDFLGVQTALAETHHRNACSYDPPNFGWSSRWPSSESLKYTSVLQSLLTALGRQEESKIRVGWGGGAENVLVTAQNHPSTVKGVVLLDASPVGIEWTDQQRARNLTMEQTTTLGKLDMQGRVTLTQIILALGIPWSLLPIFVPANDTGYFDKSHDPVHHGQSLKDDM